MTFLSLGLAEVVEVPIVYTLGEEVDHTARKADLQAVASDSPTRDVVKCIWAQH